VTDKELLKVYCDLVPFLATVFGSGCEFVIHDINDKEHSLLLIENSITGRSIGDPITDLAKQMLEEHIHNASYVCNYNGCSKGHKFVSSTYFIKNEGRPIGLLCINKDLEAVQAVQKAASLLLEQFNLKPASEACPSENLDTPVVGIVRHRIADAIAQCGVSSARMSVDEKVRIVHRINEEGLLTVKGAIIELAEQLSVSVPTVYRYINRQL
jgi:predicted transcriptional regulator YheO